MNNSRSDPKKVHPPIWRTTAFKLSALYVLLFVLMAVIVIGYVAYQSNIRLQQSQTRAIEREIRFLERQSRRGGIRQLVLAIDRVSRQPGPGLYLITDEEGTALAGNIRSVPEEVLNSTGEHSFEYLRQRAFGNDDFGERRRRGSALVRTFHLSNGYRLVVGRDIVERRGFAAIILQGFGIGVGAVIILAMIGGYVMSRRVLNRMEMITDTSAKIMSGNMSERIPVKGNGDEFDRLSDNLNAMLERIEQLMMGLKEVSDNVAHDLKTPLTRLRTRVERALREDQAPDDYKATLEKTIDECDQLIRTFNSLLMIARVEAGAPASGFTMGDLSPIVEDMAELYQPLAEEKALEFKTNIASGLKTKFNRELISQALVNLIENALKYGVPINGDKGGIEVSAGVIDEKIVLSVRDFGPSIPQEDEARVFDRFVRLEKSRTKPGSGLGLSLVRAVAQLHGGEIKLEQAEPGLKVSLILPQ